MRVSGFLKMTVMVVATALWSCSSGKVDYESAILEWTGKEIVFPDSMPLVGGGWYVNEPADFTIVSYYDSAGCTSCRLRLTGWNRLMERIGSLSPFSVDLVMVSVSGKEKEQEYILDREEFPYYFAVDRDDEFLKANVLPEERYLQTFLLDSENRIVVLGNPLDSPSLSRLYAKTLGMEEDALTSDRHPSRYHDFGKVGLGEEVRHVFRMVNNGPDTLRVREVISSCDCTEGKVSSKVISPAMAYDIVVTFRDTVPGDFQRTVGIYFENEKPEIEFEISGEIK